MFFHTLDLHGSLNQTRKLGFKLHSQIPKPYLTEHPGKIKAWSSDPLPTPQVSRCCSLELHTVLIMDPPPGEVSLQVDAEVLVAAHIIHLFVKYDWTAKPSLPFSWC